MAPPTLASESEAPAVDSLAYGSGSGGVLPLGSQGQGVAVTNSLKRTLSYKDEDDEDEGAGRQDLNKDEVVTKKLKQEADDEVAVISGEHDKQKHDEDPKEENDDEKPKEENDDEGSKEETDNEEPKEEESNDEDLDYEAQRQRNILENQRILAELGLNNGLLGAGLPSLSSRASASRSRPPSSSFHGHRSRTGRGAKTEVASDDEYVNQEDQDGDYKSGQQRRLGSSTKLKLLQDVQPVQLRQSKRLQGLKAPDTKEIVSDNTDDEDLTDDSDNETKKSKKSRRRRKYEEKQWKTRNNGVQDVLPSEQKLVARSAWRGRKQLNGFMIEVELPNNISTPLTLRSIATTIWDMGKIYDGQTNKLSYWSGNGSLYKHPYPVGFKAEKQYFRSAFAMEIQASDNGPEFSVRNMDNGQTFRGPSPTQPWTKACLASHSKGTRISGPLFFGFSDPLLQKMIENLDGYKRWSVVCAEVEREKLGLPPLPPTLAVAGPVEGRTEEQEQAETESERPPPTASDDQRALDDKPQMDGDTAAGTQPVDPSSQDHTSKEE